MTGWKLIWDLIWGRGKGTSTDYNCELKGKELEHNDQCLGGKCCLHNDRLLFIKILLYHSFHLQTFYPKSYTINNYYAPFSS